MIAVFEPIGRVPKPGKFHYGNPPGLMSLASGSNVIGEFEIRVDRHRRKMKREEKSREQR